MIVVTDGTITVNLTDDLFWEDEFTYQNVAESKEYGVTGALILQYGIKLAGREITLVSRADDSGWVAYSAVAQLKAWSLIPGKALTLTIRGFPYAVVFRQSDGPIEVRQVIDYNDYISADWCLITLRFMVTS